MKILTAVVAVSSFAVVLQASPLLVDRGLPTSNINDPVIANRSNVAWSDSPANGEPYNWAYGDDFSIGSTGETYLVTDFRVWIIGNLAHDSLNSIFSSLSLLGGKIGSTSSISASCADMTGSPSFACLDGAGIGTISTANTVGDPNLSVASVTYADSSTYQALATDFRDIYEVTFQNVNWSIEGGTSYAFFLTGVPGEIGSNNHSPTLHASNAALSGSSQDGSDGRIWELSQDSETGNSVAIEQWDSATIGWDKSSDINVQIVGSETPEPGTIGMFAGGLLASILMRRRKTA